jgi:hypothetical protein
MAYSTQPTWIGTSMPMASRAIEMVSKERGAPSHVHTIEQG